MIDLRSDTVTRPTPAMMEAIAQAELGDDVWGDDPTANQLQELAADKLGKEASLFVPSGTMGNLIAALVHCSRGEELILGDKSHVFRAEAGNVSIVGGIHPYVLKNQVDGTLALDEIEAAVRVEDVHVPHTSAIALENTHNNCGGVAIPPDYFARVRQVADRHGLAVHLDGARLFNAAVALDVPVQAFTQQVDSVMICLSKGLCAPVGSILAGSGDFICIVALEQMVDRLAEDHANAKRLAQGLNGIPGITVPGLANSPDVLTTNMVYFKLDDEISIRPESLARRMEEMYQIKIEPGYSQEFRLVTHKWVAAEDVKTTLAAFQHILS
jgi:threonine aldolase